MSAPDVASLAAGVRSGDRAALARAITLVESRRADHAAAAQDLLQALLPFSGGAWRIGITGVPGSGKSTLIDTLGGNLTRAGRRVAVLAVDPSSQVTGGSILGDKTRMSALAADPSSFIRPSPAGATLGGVARRTRETMLLCEAAGYHVVLVETVGIGQSEAAVAGMTDVFVVVLMAGAGDTLQGIKKGVIEVADILAVNKADGDNLARAQAAQGDLRAALSILMPTHPDWRPPVLLISGLQNHGLDELWTQVERHRAVLERSGALAEKRRAQQVAWMWSLMEDGLRRAIARHPAVRDRMRDLEAAVRSGGLTPQKAAEEVFQMMGLGPST